jgi:hypothetical protein
MAGGTLSHPSTRRRISIKVSRIFSLRSISILFFGQKANYQSLKDSNFLWFLLTLRLFFEKKAFRGEEMDRKAERFRKIYYLCPIIRIGLLKIKKREIKWHYNAV